METLLIRPFQTPLLMTIVSEPMHPEEAELSQAMQFLGGKARATPPPLTTKPILLA